MITTPLHYRSAPRSTTAAAALTHTWATLRLWRERARQRIQLSEMSAQMLDDIGISNKAARYEARKPFWLA